jgi:hypothetical protein
VLNYFDCGVNTSLLWAILKSRLTYPSIGHLFTIKLLKEEKFQWAKSFLTSSGWLSIQQEDATLDGLQFSITLECPISHAICYGIEDVSNSQSNFQFESEKASGSQVVPHTPEQNNISEQHSSSTTLLLPRKRKGRQLVLVDTELRRSLRIKPFNTGFKSSGCGRKNCLGYELEPPSLST